MSREEFFALLKRKCSSLAFIVVTALAIAAAMYAMYALALRLMPAETAEHWQIWLAELFHDPQSVRAWLRAKGSARRCSRSSSRPSPDRPWRWPAASFSASGKAGR